MALCEYEHCVQCPRACGAMRTFGERGFCGESAKLRAALACLHFGEEPPLVCKHGSGAIFFTGCNLRCAFCQNFQISQKGMGAPLSKKKFVDICLELQNAGAENINLVTGSHHIPLLAEFIFAAKNGGVEIPFCWNSSAYESVKFLQRLKGLVDIWLPDLKTLDAKFAKKIFLAQDYPQVAKNAIQWMIENFPLKIVRQKKTRNSQGEDEKILQGVIVRHLFLPGRFEDAANVLDWLKKNADGKAMVSLMTQYSKVPFEKNTPQTKRKSFCIENRALSAQDDADLLDLVTAYDFETLFYQELGGDDSWLPDFENPRPFAASLAKVVWHWKGGWNVQNLNN